MVARARADLRLGLPIVIRDKDRELVFLAAEGIIDERLSSLLALGGETIMAVTSWRAATLKARAYDGDLARIFLPKGQTGRELGAWVQAIADPVEDLAHPMKGPLSTIREGNPTLYRLALMLTKSAQLLPAIVGVERQETLAVDDVTRLAAGAVAANLDHAQNLAPIAAARLPLAAAQHGRLHVLRPDDGGIEHYAVEIGRPDRAKPVLARLHSACFTGDVLGSLKCDCGPQLHGALAAMNEAGAGILLYLNQEGRGIGLANKMRAYALQDQGFDTVEANHRLGFEDDERDFRLGAAILKKLGFRSVRLMTNNPKKLEMLAAEGLEVVERVPLVVGVNPLNRGYLETKRSKSGHLL